MESSCQKIIENLEYDFSQLITMEGGSNEKDFYFCIHPYVFYG